MRITCGDRVSAVVACSTVKILSRRPLNDAAAVALPHDDAEKEEAQQQPVPPVLLPLSNAATEAWVFPHVDLHTHPAIMRCGCRTYKGPTRIRCLLSRSRG
jgi:hypothetical protein